MGEKEMKNKISPSAYDDVFRTLVTDCRQLVIPVINEAFGEQYTGDEEVVFRANEHFQGRQDGYTDKIITDSSFQIIGKNAKSYLLECQSTADNSMIVRIYEYITQIALDEGEITENKLIVEIPNSAVLFLRSTKNTPDLMQIEMRTPGGNVEFNVQVLKVKDYTIEDIFTKKLFFLIPFYIFTYEARFKEIEENDERLHELKKEYSIILDRLDAASETGLISAFTRKTIVEMSNKVVEKIAEKYEKVREGVKSVMGGRVLEHEAKKILDEGKKEQAIETALKMIADGQLSLEKIAQYSGLTLEEVKELADKRTA